MANTINENQVFGAVWSATATMDTTGTTSTVTICTTGTIIRPIDVRGSLTAGTGTNPVVDWQLEDGAGSILFRPASGAGASASGKQFNPRMKVNGAKIRVRDLSGTAPAATVMFEYQHLQGTAPTVV
jgi:hypothetical protein